MSDKAPWITFRPELKVLDCTVRDGGLVNAHQFSDDFVRAVYRACVEAGIDYMEIGYKNSPKIFPKEKFGPWRHCDETDLSAWSATTTPRRPDSSSRPWPTPARATGRLRSSRPPRVRCR